MLSEPIHSVVDCGNQLLMLFGLRRASQPASVSHPFGHGLQLHLWTFAVAVTVFGDGAGVSFVEGIRKILNPLPVAHPLANYVVIALAFLFEGSTWLVAVRAFSADKGERGWLEAVRFSKDPTVFTVLFKDTAALLGLVAALGGIGLASLLHRPVFDGVASLAISAILAGTSLFLGFECRSLLTGEAASPEMRRGIADIVGEEAIVRSRNEALTIAPLRLDAALIPEGAKLSLAT